MILYSFVAIDNFCKVIISTPTLIYSILTLTQVENNVNYIILLSI